MSIVLRLGSALDAALRVPPVTPNYAPRARAPNVRRHHGPTAVGAAQAGQRVDIQLISAAVDSCFAAQAACAIRPNGIATRPPRPKHLAAMELAGQAANQRLQLFFSGCEYVENRAGPEVGVFVGRRSGLSQLRH